MDSKLLEALKTRVNDEKERFVVVEEGHLLALAQCLVTEDDEQPQVVDALEVLFYLSTEGSLRHKVAAIDGLVNNIKKFMSRGRLKQKKLAIMTYKNLQLAVPAAREDLCSPSPLSEITNKDEDSLASIVPPSKTSEAQSETTTDEAPSSPLLMSKKATLTKTRPALGARIRAVPAAGSASASAPAPGSATTVNLFVEGMHSVEARTQVEQALLRREGIISFFSDIADEKIVIRTTLNVEELFAHIWDTCRMRASTVKGDYSGFKASGYLDENAAAKGGWLWGISSLLQIIAVKNDGSSVPVPPTPVKATPAMKPLAPAAAAGKGEKGWLGNWW